MDDSQNKLIRFLRTLANDMEESKLSNKQIQRVGEFYMTYEFQEQAYRDGQEDDIASDTDEQDIVKFVSLGWYVYNRLLKGLRESEERTE